MQKLLAYQTIEERGNRKNQGNQGNATALVTAISAAVSPARMPYNASMQIFVVAGFAIVAVLMQNAGDEPVGPVWLAPVMAAAYVATAWLGARAAAGMGLRRMMDPAVGQPGRAPGGMIMGVQAFMLTALAMMMVVGWDEFVLVTLRLEGAPLLGRAAAIAPFVLALLGYWWAMYPLDQAMRLNLSRRRIFDGEAPLPIWSRRQYVDFNVRQNLLFIAVPVGLIVLGIDVLILLETRKVLLEGAAMWCGLAWAATVFAIAPSIIVRIWRTRRLEDGPLRDRLEAMCRRYKVRCRRILVWDTGGVVVNAGVLGFFRPARYVLLSDALLRNFDDDAIAVIFAHEAGHVVHRHIPFMAAFSMGLMMLFSTVGLLAGQALGFEGDGLSVQGPTLMLAGPAWLMLFGLLSRRFERQADVFAAAALGCPDEPTAPLTEEGVELFARSLLTVGRLNGIAPERRNFRHGPIQHRVDFLRRLAATGRGRAEVDRRIRIVKIAAAALLVLGAAGMLL